MINRLLSQRYEILEKIGESALFTVYKARDKTLNRVVAIKAVSPAEADDVPFMQGLQRGLTASAILNHPDIATFYEAAQDGDTQFAVFEFVRGINLKERIRRIAPFTLSAAVDIACSIGEALHYAHSLNQPHGDLRPHNVIISPEGAVKVTDFGIMSGVARSPAAQRELLMRAAPYHAPELSMSQPGSAAGDIYAMGAILYEMLTGSQVYAASSPEAIADLHISAPIPSPRAFNQGIPRSIEGIVVKCLQKRPERRYASAAELLNDLKSVRDALRFGKPLSWSPIDLDPPVETAATSRSAAPKAEPPPAAVVPPREPVATATSSRAAAMPANNRLRAQDERVSTVIKVMIGVMTSVILLCLIGFVAIFRLDWAVPQPVTLPTMVGRPLDQVRADAARLHLKLIEHGDYLDRPRNIVYKTDKDPGSKLQTGHSINIWYSLGPMYVDVPNVVGLTVDEARQKLTDAGLTVGRVMPQFSKTVKQGLVIDQNVSHKKRVLHDTVVDLNFSDGPQPDYAGAQSTDNGGNSSGNDSGNGGDGNSGDNGTNQDNPTPDNSGAGTPATTPSPPAGSNSTAAASDTANLTPHQFDRAINITNTPEHGQGTCHVRIEYDDAINKHQTLAEDDLKEGERVPVSFTYYGNNITLRIYYDNNLVFDKTFDPEKAKGKITGGKTGGTP